MPQREIQFSYKARYFKIGEITPETKQVWIVLHGYGQLAEFFIRKFTVLEENNVCVIAPEGLSKFYLEDVQSRSQSGNNRVGASWMTKENRQMDITNYLEYLNTIYQTEVGRHPDVAVTILGFSQGAATASRWVVENKISVDRLVLWAGILPPDMDVTVTQRALANKKVVFVYGESDPFVTDTRFAEMKSLASKLHLSPIYISFDGGHEVDEKTLEKVARI